MYTYYNTKTQSTTAKSKFVSIILKVNFGILLARAGIAFTNTSNTKTRISSILFWGGMKRPGNCKVIRLIWRAFFQHTDARFLLEGLGWTEYAYKFTQRQIKKINLEGKACVTPAWIPHHVPQASPWRSWAAQLPWQGLCLLALFNQVTRLEQY